MCQIFNVTTSEETNSEMRMYVQGVGGGETNAINFSSGNPFFTT